MLAVLAVIISFFFFLFSQLWFQQKLFWMRNSICLSMNICEISFSFSRWSFSFLSTPQGCDTLEFTFCLSVLCLHPLQKATQILICIKKFTALDFPQLFSLSLSLFFFTAYNQKQKWDDRRINSLHLPLYGQPHCTNS